MKTYEVETVGLLLLLMLFRYYAVQSKKLLQRIILLCRAGKLYGCDKWNVILDYRERRKISRQPKFYSRPLNKTFPMTHFLVFVAHLAQANLAFLHRKKDLKISEII